MRRRPTGRLGDGDIEVLHQTFKLQQTQTDLPNGVYEAVFHAFYRNDGSGQQPVATAAAENTVNGNLNALQDIKKNEVLLNTEETMAGAAQTLTSDQAQTTLSDIIVADHQMTLSANVTNSSLTRIHLSRCKCLHPAIRPSITATRASCSPKACRLAP